MSKGKFKYDGDSINTLNDLEALRINASMYAGSLGLLGIKKLFGEVVENSRDEAKIRKALYEAGERKDPLLVIKIELREDGSVVVEDNGRGIPVGINSKTGLPAIYSTLEKMHSGGKLKNDANSSYDKSIGVHGIGLSLVNACSKYVDVKVKQDGEIHHLRYEDGGAIKKDIEVIGNCSEEETGTRIEMMYDEEVMQLIDENSRKSDYPFIIEDILRYLEDLVTFSDNLKIEFTWDTGEGVPEEEREEGKIYEKGQKGSKEITREEYSMEKLINNHSRGYEIREFNKENEEIDYKLTMLYNFTDSFCEGIKLSAVNGLRMTSGSSHQDAFEEVVFNFFEVIMRNKKLLKDGYDLEPEDVVNKLNYIMNLETERRNFTGQEKSRYRDDTITDDLRREFKVILNDLSADEVERVLESIVFDYSERVKQAERYKKEREKKMPRRNKRTSQKALEKFKDCRNGKGLKKKNRVWFLEGDSAANGFASGRDANTEAYACFKGKPLNVIKNSIRRARVDSRGNKVLVDYEQFIMVREIVEMNKFSAYMICTDADIDGKHIRNLTIFMFYKYFPHIIERGELYIVESPLYKLEKGKEVKYAYGEEDRKEYEELGFKLVARYKGLGEVEGNLYQILEEEKRFIRVTMDDVKYPLREELIDLTGEDEVDSDTVVQYLAGKDSSMRRLIAREFMTDKLKGYLDKERKLRREFMSKVNPLYIDENGVPMTQDEVDMLEVEREIASREAQ